jgi:hypothetical protein
MAKKQPGHAIFAVVLPHLGIRLQPTREDMAR